MNQLRVGKRVKVKTKCGKGNGRSVVTHEGTVEYIHDKFITINTGKYRISVLKADINCGEAIIKAVGE